MKMTPGDVDLSINAELVRSVLTAFLRKELGRAGFAKAVLGLSGGVDSATVAYLCAEALSPENVLAVMMPYGDLNPEGMAHARKVVEATGARSLTVDITRQVDAYFEGFPDAGNLRRGNKMARERMSILYDLSAAERALVVGTSNKTELLLGYGTLFGDMACAVNPVGDLYKTQLRQLARHVGVPEEIVVKSPSADLWVGQTDEQELGFKYEEVDRLLYLMVDKRYSQQQLVEAGFPTGLVRRVASMVRRFRYKRSLPLIAEVSETSSDRNFRYSRDWGS